MPEEEKPNRTVNFKAFAILGAILIVAGAVVWYVCADANQSPVDRALAATSEKSTSQETSSTATNEAPEPAPVDNWHLEPLDDEISTLLAKHGARFQVPQRTSLPLMDRLISKIPPYQFVNLLALYEKVEGLDGSTTSEALAKLQASDIGKYYMLQGDTFKIQVDRDYPREGLTEFSVFGEVRLYGDRYIPVNVDCISSQKIPPFDIIPILGKIVDFRLGTNRRDETIIIPVVKVVAAVRPSGCCGEPEDVFINQN